MEARPRKLRRLPHVFGGVLELPLGSDADVAVEEDDSAFRFVAMAACGCAGDVRVDVTEVVPGVVRVVVWGGGDGVAEELEVDRWRVRLPEVARPALATVEYVGGELVVTVPK